MGEGDDALEVLADAHCGSFHWSQDVVMSADPLHDPAAPDHELAAHKRWVGQLIDIAQGEPHLVGFGGEQVGVLEVVQVSSLLLAK